MRTIAYLGDSRWPGPASYLAGIMTHYRMPFSYVPSNDPPPDSVFTDDVGLYVLSDYPSANWGAAAMARLCARVRDGAGLLMLGGWESYHGLGGDYDATPLAELLPVRIAPEDDRRNWPQLILVRKAHPVRKALAHPVLAGLPLEQPPSIGGYNAFVAKPDAAVVLEGEPYRIACPDGGAPAFTALQRFPLLVTGESAAGPAGAGRRACLATDVAPHWVGGLVDWGERRLTVRMEHDFIEVGADYAALFHNLLAWCLGEISANAMEIG